MFISADRSLPTNPSSSPHGRRRGTGQTAASSKRMSAGPGRKRPTVRSASLLEQRGDSKRRSPLGLLLLGDRSKSAYFRERRSDESRRGDFRCAVFWNGRVENLLRHEPSMNIWSAKEDRHFEAPLFQQRGTAKRRSKTLQRKGVRSKGRVGIGESKRKFRLSPLTAQAAAHFAYIRRPLQWTQLWDGAQIALWYLRRTLLLAGPCLLNPFAEMRAVTPLA